MKRYNIALLPTNNTFRERLIKISRDYFYEIHDKYILGLEGLPHVTLCQFKSDNVEIVKEVYRAFLDEISDKIIRLEIKDFNLREGSLVNSGKFIAEYKVKPKSHLMDMQIQCAKVLKKYNISNLTPSDRYNPHITLARLSAKPEKIPELKTLENPVSFESSFAVGLSTEEGVFCKELYTDQN